MITINLIIPYDDYAAIIPLHLLYTTEGAYTTDGYNKNTSPDGELTEKIT